MLKKSILVGALAVALAGCGAEGSPVAPTIDSPGGFAPTVIEATPPPAAATSPAGEEGTPSTAAAQPASPSTGEVPEAEGATQATTQAQAATTPPAELTGNAVQLAPNGTAILALAGQDATPADLHVAATYHVASLAGGTEVALRAKERKVAKLKPKHRYALAATTSQQLGDTARFWVTASSDAGDRDVRVTARTAYVGERCTVMVDQQVGAALDERAVEMGQAFDAKLYPTDTKLFGAPLTDGHDPKITILLSPEVDDHGRGATLGYFTVLDLFSPTDYPKEPALAHSNDRLMLYVSSAVAQHAGPEDYLGTLAHELQHLISATHKAFGSSEASQEDVWLNEGLSMYAMQANGFGLASNARALHDHVAAYLASPGSWSLTDWDADPHGSGYGAAYLFVTYLAERAGEGVLKDLVASADTGTANLDARLAPKGLTFDKVFRDWVQAMLTNGYRSIDLRAGDLQGPAVKPLDLPGSASIKVLPRSANYLQLHSTEGGRFDLGLTGAKAEGWLAK